jgi:phosphonate utilization transcriptional regulator
MNEASVPVVSAIELLRTQSLSALAQREIERMIVAGELRAGERVNENSLATRLGISRGPIREACRALAQAGLLDAFVNRGVFVRRLEIEEAAELYDIRASLAGLVGRSLAPVVTDQQIASLAALVERMADAAAANDVDTYYPVNLEFHDRLVEHCGQRRLAALYRSLAKELSLFRQTGLTQPGNLVISNAEHQAILDAVRSRDPRRAAGAMESHVDHAKQRMLRAVAAQGVCGSS